MNRKKELIVILSSLLVIVLSVSVAYFTTKILGTGKEISVESADLKVIFTSGSGTINGTNIEPGWSSGVNSFTVKNESNGIYKYNIIIKDLVNTFVTEGFLQYKITSADGGYNMSEFKDVPKSSTPNDEILAYSVEIANGKTHSYNVEFKYTNSETESQNEDMGKTLSGTLYIEKGTLPTLANTIKSYSNSHTNGVYNENGYRYEGTDPNNYIYMTNKSTNEKELWRIVGVFNDGENGEEVIRVRRHYEKDNYPSLGYDSNETNHFPNTTLYSTLSSTYNLTNYNHTVNFKMYLGITSCKSGFSLTSSDWFIAERGSTPGVTAKDKYNSSTSFVGSVGLIYPSDYGYAVLASDCPRTTKTDHYSYPPVGIPACYLNNWLYQGTDLYQWLISPSADEADNAFSVNSSGFISNSRVNDGYLLVNHQFALSPVMSLEAGVLVNGSGTKADPYTITN